MCGDSMLPAPPRCEKKNNLLVREVRWFLFIFIFRVVLWDSFGGKGEEGGDRLVGGGGGELARRKGGCYAGGVGAVALIA